VEVDVTEAIPPAAKAAVMRRGAAGRPITIDVTGSSMGKVIPSGARVLVAASARPRRGEIWAFVVDDGMVIVHRFRREHEGELWFQGDGNAGVDRPVQPEMLVGRVVAVEVGDRRRRLGVLARVRGRLRLDGEAVLRRSRIIR
jgi:phage repressor protein C with HTH and peptisase S24 domain